MVTPRFQMRRKRDKPTALAARRGNRRNGALPAASVVRYRDQRSN
jgi:hypothetical protein